MLRQGLRRRAARVRGAAQDQAERHDRQADARRGRSSARARAARPSRSTSASWRGAEAAEHLLQPRHLLFAREARRRRVARGRALHQGQAASTPRATFCTCDALYEQRNIQRALTECQQAERQDQVNGAIKGKIGRIYLGMKNYQSARDLPRAGGGGAEGVGRRQGSRDARRARRGVRGGARAEGQAQLDRRRSRVAVAKTRRRWRRRGRSTSSRGNDERAMSALQCVAGARAEQRRRARGRWSRVLNRRAGLAVEKNEVGTAYNLLSEAVEAVARRSHDQSQPRARAACLAKKYSEAEQVLARVAQEGAERHGRQSHAGARAARSAQDDGRRRRPTRRRRRWRCARAGPIWRRSTPSSGRCTPTRGSSIRR